MERDSGPSISKARVPAYPVKVCPTGRYLVDQNGLPYLIHGDTAWSLISGLTAEDVERYLKNRRHKGFNSILVTLVSHKFNGPRNRQGENPFTKMDDLSTPNDTYFDFADWCVQKAGEYGIQVFLAPMWLGYRTPAEDNGWYTEALATGVAGCREYGRYLGQRYARFDNVVWVMGGDRLPGEALEHMNALAEGIKERDDRHLRTAHPAPELSPVDEYSGGGWLTLNVTYTYGIVHQQLLRDYRRTPVMPFFLIESTYDGEHNASEVQIRRQAYWANLCGSTGQFVGIAPLWGFHPGWQAAMDGRASQDMAHFKALFDSRPWWELVPDDTHSVVTAGIGEHRGLDTLTAARTADGSTAIAYLPSARTVTVDLAQISGEAAQAWWFRPRTGDVELVGAFPTRRWSYPTWELVHHFTPPGEGDWVLVLDDVAKGLPGAGDGIRVRGRAEIIGDARMKALRKTRSEAGAELVEVQTAAVGADEVLVRVDMAAICGSDLPLYSQPIEEGEEFHLPFTMGHEFSGTVVERGSSVTSLQPGDQVSGETHYPCGSCFQCMTGEQHICANLKLVGRQLDGCFAEYCILPQICARKIPRSLTPHQGALLEPLGVAVHAVTEAEVWGKPVAILGIGPIGAMTVAVASRMGATRIFATSRTPAKLRMAEQMGASSALNPSTEDVVQEVLDATDGVGVGAVIDLTGDSAAVDQGFRMLRKGGRVVFVAPIAGPVVQDMLRHILWKEAKISGIHGRRMFETWNLAEELVWSGKVSLEPVMGETFDLSDFQPAFRKAAARTMGRVFLKP